MDVREALPQPWQNDRLKDSIIKRVTEARERGKTPDLSHEYLVTGRLHGVDLRKVNLNGTDLTGADLGSSELDEADLGDAELQGATLQKATLVRANLGGANLRRTNLSEAILTGANLSNARLGETNFRRAELGAMNLSGLNLSGCNLRDANLTGATLHGTDLSEADLDGAIFCGADLTGANLTGTRIVRANLEKANLSGCSVYGVSAWEVNLEGAIQSNLTISPPGAPKITADNLEVAQFIYLLLNNKKIREVIDTVTSKVVLILGRFTEPRKSVLEAIREELRKANYLPVLFDFEKPSNRDVTETVSTLAHMSRFIIADLTDPSSIPHELATIVPHLRSTPIQPLRLRGSGGYSMFDDLKAYPWVLEVHQYESDESLIETFDDVLAPAEQKVLELRGNIGGKALTLGVGPG